MKSLNKVTTVLAILAAITTQTVFAEINVDNLDSRFTPLRPAIPFIEDVTKGLPYPSFNNFKNNPNILNTETAGDPENIKGDERAFTEVRICQSANCQDNRPLYDNTTRGEIESGDRLRFKLYFHNNGDDPYNGDDFSSPDAQNVMIGLDLSTFTVDQEKSLLRPKGFIYADNNEYRLNTSQPSSRISEGNNPIPSVVPDIRDGILRTATDDTQVLVSSDLDPAAITLKAVPDSVYLQFKGLTANAPDQLIKISTTEQEQTIQLKTSDPNEPLVEVKATTHLQNNIVWVELNHLPGCFAYSGFAFFDATVETPEQNFCNALTASLGSTVTIDNQQAYEINIDSSRLGLTPEQLANPATKLQISSSNDLGKVYKKDIFSGEYIALTGQTAPILTSKVAYIGNPNDRVTISVIGNNIIGPNSQCNAQVTIPSQPQNPICTDFALDPNVQASFQLPNGSSLHALSVDKLTYSNNVIPANAQIRWHSDNASGKFYPSLYEAINDRNAYPANAQGFVFTPTNKKTIFYVGQGNQIDAVVVPSSGTACRDSISLNPICTELVIDNNEPIIEGYLSTIKAQAYDQNGNPYVGGGVEYAVDDASYGFFSLIAPPGVALSPSPITNRIIGLLQIIPLRQEFANLSPGIQATLAPTGIYGNQEPWNNIPIVDKDGVPATDPDAIDAVLHTYGIDLNINNNDNTSEAITNSARDIQPAVDQQALKDLMNNRQINGIRLPAAQNNLPSFTGPTTNPNLDSNRPIFNTGTSAGGANVLGALAANINSSNNQLNSGLKISEQRSPSTGAGLQTFAAPLNSRQSQEYTEAQALAGIFFNALKGSDGQNVIHVTQQDPNGHPLPQCSQDLPIVSLVCNAITVGITDNTGAAVAPNQNLAPNKTYRVNANSAFIAEGHADLGTLHKNGTGLHYEVPAGRGIFLSDQAPIVLTGLQLAQNQGRITDEASLRAYLNGIAFGEGSILGNTVDQENPSTLVLVTFAATNVPDVALTITTTGETAGKENPACTFSKPIVAEQGELICENLTFTIDNPDSDDIQPNSIHTLTAESTFSGDTPNPNQVHYKVGPNDGIIITDDAAIVALQAAIDAGTQMTRTQVQRTLNDNNAHNSRAQELTVNAGEKVTVIIYSGANVGRSIITITQVGDNIGGLENCTGEVTLGIPPEQLACISLDPMLQTVSYNPLAGIVTNAAVQLDRGKTYQVTPKSEFLNGQPQTDEVKVSINPQYGAIIENVNNDILKLLGQAQADGTFTAADLQAIAPGTDSIVVTGGTTVYFVTYSNAPSGSLADILQIAQSDSANEGIANIEACQANIGIPELPGECIAVNAKITNILTGDANRVGIEPNSLYNLNADPSYDNIDPATTQVRYQIDPTVGLLITGDFGRQSPLVLALEQLATVNKLSLETLTTFFEEQNIVSSTDLTVPRGQAVTLITFSNLADPNPSALQINAVDADGSQFNNPSCDVDVPLTIPNLACVNLDLNTANGQPFDPSKKMTAMTISAQQFPSDRNIHVSIDGPCQISKNANAPANERLNEFAFTPAEISADADGKLEFYVYCDNFNNETDSLTIKADGGAGCSDQITITPSPKELECISLDITRPSAPWEIDENDRRENIVIDVVTNPGGRWNQLYYTWTVQGATWSNGDTKITERGELSQVVEELDRLRDGDDVRVQVYASRDAAGNDIFTNAAGQQICIDNIRGRLDITPPKEREKPEIVKGVYPEGDTSKIDDSITIGESTRYVTYRAAFTPGSKTDSVAITDESFAGGYIRSSDGGRLIYKGMEIVVQYTGSKRDEVIFRTKAYNEDEEDTNHSINNVSGERDCADARSNEVCVVDPEDIGSRLANGEPFIIDHITSNVERILIKYQANNDSGVTSATCASKNAPIGCGRKFPNRISFVDSEKDRGNDRADVTVLCPYVLSRQGGDVFFHDIINAGADIGQCVPVKGSTGIGVKITRLPEQNAPSTGGGTETAPILDLPSHDICKFSNNDSNIEGYNDALKNFSSSVCELQASVAESLYETNINKAVKQNLTRLARWDGNLDKQSTLANLSNLDNASSGVFVKRNGDLEINNELTITADGKVPAAQTYIIDGHDLIIHKDIKYGPADYLKPNGVPSVAFIVINGNIHIDKDVEQLDGIYMALNTENNDKGQIISVPSDVPLTIHGSLIGNVIELFKNRTAVGDPRYNQGSVTIQYDEGILINTPPGIGDLINVQQAIVPN